MDADIHSPTPAAGADPAADRRDVSATQVDWSREVPRPGQWSPGCALLSSIRDYQKAAAAAGPLAAVRRKAAILRHRFWSVVTAADIPLNCQIGGGLLLPHPTGVVIHPQARIGPNCLIFQGVTLGAGSRAGLPDIGGHVDIGAGARILGGVRVGDHARIGANAVVLTDVPAYGVAVGIPARIVGGAP